MHDNQNIPEVGAPIPPNAVSVYGPSDAMDDFPVLKAFQQYVDAEHAKAQKRMTTLCIFFVVLMVAVISVFVILLMNISSRNSALSDQLFQFMIKDRQNAFVQQPTPADASLKAMADLQQRLMDQQMKFAEEMMKKAAAQAGAPGEPVTQSERAEFTAQRRAHERETKAEAEKLRKAQAALKAEKARIAKERERLRQKEIDLQRRKLYPEAYAPAPAPAAKPAAQEDDDLAAVDAELAREENAVRNGEGPVRYFNYDNDDDLDDFVNSLEVPAPAKPAARPSAKAGGWDIPLD